MVAVNLNPENFMDGGGLIDDVDCTFTSCSFDMFDYNGKVVPGVPSLKIEMGMEDDEVATQYYSVGSSEDWVPSEDGKQLMAIGRASNLRVSSNGGIFFKSLVDAGFPADKLGDDISILDGLKAHVIRVPAPKRPGIKKTGEKKFEETILIVGEILTLPWEKKKGVAGKTAGKAASKTAGKAASKSKVTDTDTDMENAAMNTILSILEDVGSITKKELPSKIFQTEKGNPDRNAIVKIAFDDKFLAEGPWEYNDGVLVTS